VPVVRESVLKNHPEVGEVLNRLGGILSVEEMRKLNYQVDGEKRQARDVVRELLLEKGLLSQKTLAHRK
jgi:osmoprotectant transport system substrate-binding protein